MTGTFISGEGWFLEKIAINVSDPRDGGGETKVFNFPCGRWLDSGQDDGKIAREIMASEQQTGIDAQKEIVRRVKQSICYPESRYYSQFLFHLGGLALSPTNYSALSPFSSFRGITATSGVFCPGALSYTINYSFEIVIPQNLCVSKKN